MGQVQRRVYAVVELYDSFTRKPVPGGSCHVASEIKKNIIAKENGIFLFLDVPEMENLTVTFFSDNYFSRSVVLSALPERGGYRHRILWLIPNENYVYPLQTAMVEGVLPPGKKGSRFHMVLEREDPPVYLGKDYAAGEPLLSVCGFLNEQFSGMEGIFYAGQKPASELFTLAGPAEQAGFYRLEKPLKKSYKKGESVLHRAYPVPVSADRRFLMAFPLSKGKKLKCDLLKDGKIIETWEIEAGKNGRKE
jgi:hypothetical protein